MTTEEHLAQLHDDLEALAERLDTVIGLLALLDTTP